MSDFESKVRIDIDASQALAQIKLLQRQISDFHSSMAKGSATANLKSLQMQQSLVDTINATGQYSAQMKTVASSTQAFTTSLEKNKLSLNQYFKYAGGASRSFGKFFKTEMDTIQKVAIERVKDLQTQYIKMGRDANGALKTIAVRPLALDMENLSTKTQIAAQKQQLLNQLLKQGSTNLLNFGKNTQWAGRQLMVGFSIPLGILGATAAKTFMEMEKQAVSFKRVYGDTFTPSAETDKMLKQVKDLASEFTKYGVAVEKTMESAAKAAATGKMGADLIAQVSESTRLSVLGNVEQQKALETTISLTNAFGTSADELRGKINFLNAVENQTVTSIEDLTTAIPKAAPVIKQLGGNVEDLSFFLTAMREGGINASEGANALKSGLASLINPTNKASKMLEGFGINIQSIVQKNKGDVKGLVIDFAKALDTLDPLNRARAIEQLFGKFQFSRLSTLFQNVIKQGSQASKVLELTKQSSAELGILAQKELNRISSSPMYKFQKAVADFKKELAPVGEEFIKAVTPLIQFGTDVLKAFNNLDGGVKQFIITTTGVIAGLGPIMLMTFGLIANGVANLIKGFSFVKSIFNKTTTASQVLGETTDYMTQQQIEAAAVAASLDQVHNKLTQSFTVEARAVANLAAQYEKAISAQVAFSGVPARGGKTKAAPKKYASGIFSVPGPKGAGDIIPAMLAPGEAVIPAGPAQKYRGFIKGMIAGKIPGFANGKVGTDNIDWSNFSKAERDSLTKKLRSAPDALKAEKDAMTWTTKNKEIELIKKRLQELGKTQTVIDRYTQIHASHLKPSKVSRNIGGRSFAMSDFSNASNLTPDVGLINQFTQQISQRVAKGEITAKQIKSIVGKSMTTAEIQDQLKRLAAGEHISATPAGNKVLNAVAQHASSGAMKLGVGTRDIAPIVAEVTKMRTADTSSKGFLKGIGQRKFSQNTLARGQVQIESTLKGIYNKAKKMLSDSEYRAAQTANKKAIAAESQSAQQRTTTAKTEKKTSVAKSEAAKAEKKAAVAKSQAAKTEEKDAKKKTAVKVNATPTTSVTEQLGNGVTRITNSDGKVQYKIGGKYANAEKAQSLINETTASKKTTRRGRAGSFLSRRGALGGLGMAASMGGSMMGGDIGNTIANIGNAAFIADVGRSFIPAGVKAKLAQGFEKFAETFSKGFMQMATKTKILIGIGGGVLTAATVAYQILNASNQKQEDIATSISQTLNNTQDRLNTINDFFGTQAKISGIRSQTLGVSGQRNQQASLSEQYRQSEQFKTAYGDIASGLAAATKQQAKLTLESLATELLASNVGQEQAQIIIDAIAKEANKTDLRIKVKSLSLESQSGVAKVESNISSALKNYQDATSGIFSFLKGNQQDAAIKQASSSINAISAAYQNGSMSGVAFSNAMIKINQEISKFNGGGLREMRKIIESLNPELAGGFGKISNKSDSQMVFNSIAAGIQWTPDQLNALVKGTEKTKSAIRKAEGKAWVAAGKNAKKLADLQDKLSGASSKKASLVQTEAAINKKYDDRITALERINNLQQQISERQQGQLTLANALSQGDVFGAAQAVQDIRSKDAQNALDLQKQSLQDSKANALAPIQNQQAAIDNAVQNIQNQVVKQQQMTITIDSFLPKGFDISKLKSSEMKTAYSFGRPLLPNAGTIISDNPIKTTKATGGHITGPGSGTSDSIPAMLSNGEYVIRANAVKAIGTDALDKLNHADKAKFAKGGLVQRFSEGGQPALDSMERAVVERYLTNPLSAYSKYSNKGSIEKIASKFTLSGDQMFRSATFNEAKRLSKFAVGQTIPQSLDRNNQIKSFVGPSELQQIGKLAKGMGGNTGANNDTYPSNTVIQYVALDKNVKGVQSVNGVAPGMLDRLFGWTKATPTPYFNDEGFIGAGQFTKILSKSTDKHGFTTYRIGISSTPFQKSNVGRMTPTPFLPGGNSSLPGYGWSGTNQKFGVGKANGGLIKFAKGGLAAFRQSEHKGTPKKRFGLSDIAAGLSNPMIQGGANGTDVMGGFKTAQSYMNVASGKGDFWDWLTAIASPFALAGFGGASKIGMFGKLGNSAKTTSKTSLGFSDYIPGLMKQSAKKNNPIAIRARSQNFINQLKSGDLNYRNKFETEGMPGTQQYGDDLSRLKAEQNVFGIPFDAPGSQRPIYGAVVNPHMPMTKRSIKASSDMSTAKSIWKNMYGNILSDKLDRYGDISLLLKDSVKKRSTFTLGDTFSPQNLSDIGNRTVPAKFGTRSNSKIQNATSESKNWSSASSFIEAQIFGGLPFSDIKKIIIKDPSLIPVLQQHLAEAGLKIPVGLPKVSLIDKIKMFFLKNKTFKGNPVYEPMIAGMKKLPKVSGKATKINSLFGYAKGGLVNVPQFKSGGMFRTGYAGGGLARLHDKEFVMNAGAVKDYGVNNLKAMNNGTYNNGSVYNSYGVNINVGGSNSNASDIARTVIREIKKIDSQQIRSTRI